MSTEKIVAAELLKYAKGQSSETRNNTSVESAEEWINCKKDAPVTVHMMADKTVSMVMNLEDQVEECDSNSEEIQERLITDEIIKLGDKYIQALEQRNFIMPTFHEHLSYPGCAEKRMA